MAAGLTTTPTTYRLLTILSYNAYHETAVGNGGCDSGDLGVFARYGIRWGIPTGVTGDIAMYEVEVMVRAAN